MQQAFPPPPGGAGVSGGRRAPSNGAELPAYAEFEFGPMTGVRARTSSAGLAEVAIDAGGRPSAYGSSTSGSGGSDKGKEPAVGGRQAIQLTVDSRTAAAAGPQGATGGRQESVGLEYAPDSKAVMARVNRWWKNFDEGFMQPHFGGPAASGASSSNLQALAGGGAGGCAAAAQPSAPVHRSSTSFTVPVSRPGG
jgi:hypothetical protein